MTISHQNHDIDSTYICNINQFSIDWAIMLLSLQFHKAAHSCCLLSVQYSMFLFVLLYRHIRFLRFNVRFPILMVNWYDARENVAISYEHWEKSISENWNLRRATYGKNPIYVNHITNEKVKWRLPRALLSARNLKHENVRTARRGRVTLKRKLKNGIST